MLINKIYKELNNEGIVKDRYTFSEKFLKCSKNTYNYLNHKKRDMSVNTQLTCFKQLSKQKPTQAVSECMNLISSNIKSKYALNITV